MTEMIELLKNHRTIRKFKDETLSKETVKELVLAGQAASTSSYVQAYSIIGVTDVHKKRQLKEISTQNYVEENGHLFIFLADVNRLMRLSKENIEFDLTEHLLLGIVDATLASQNVAIAAESKGLGICYLGSIRNDLRRVVEILNLPKGVIPLFGMAVGVPDQKGSVKERLPFEAVYFENEYQTVDNENVKSAIDAYDERVSQYYYERTNGERADKWSEQVTALFVKKIREDVDEVIKAQGFLKQ